MNDLARLRWRCRRGTREMDLLLESFLDECYGDLPEDQQLAFARLLDESDVDILDWVTGKTCPEVTAYRGVIEILQTRMKR
jgi:antitoxin CptB